jgi:hypothetical protein
VAEVENGEQMLKEMAAAVVSPTGRVSVGPAFSVQGTYWGTQVYDGRKKVGMFMVCREDQEQTPANALRALADLIEAAGD